MLPSNTYKCHIDNARYLLVRLALRKADKWHRLSSLKYESELGKLITAAIVELCRNPKEACEVQVEAAGEAEPEIIDLTLDEDDIQPHAAPRLQPIPRPELDLTVFAQDESNMSLHELLESLRTDELKAIAKERKLNTNQTVRIYFTLLHGALIPSYIIYSVPL